MEKENRVSCNSTCYLATCPKGFDSGQARSDDDRYALHSLCSIPDPLSPKGNLKKVLHRILAGRCLVVMMMTTTRWERIDFKQVENVIIVLTD